MAEEHHSDEENGYDGRLARNTGSSVAVGIAIGAAVFAMTDEPSWMALGVVLGVTLGAAFFSARAD